MQSLLIGFQVNNV